MDPDAIDRVLRKYAKAIGLTRGTRRIRCALPLLQRPLRTVRPSTMYSEPPVTPSLPPPSSTTGAAIIRRNR